jgi:hypothetical protein
VSIVAIEINDAGIRAGDPSGRADRRIGTCPGIALIDDGAILTGTAAADQARLKPKRVHDRFWSRLDTSPLPPPFPDDLSHADLAHAQLNDIWQRIGSQASGVIVAAPGSHTDEQLGLILGIARSCGMPVNGLVDAALAASTHVAVAHAAPTAHASPAAGSLLHLDLQRHRIVVTELTRGAELRRGPFRASEQAGLASLQAAWMREIARIFINRTRFDPLHVATAEQSLYQQLPQLLSTLCRDTRVVVELEAAGKIYAIELSRQDAAAAVAADYETIVHLVRTRQHLDGPVVLLVSHRASMLPGLAEQFDSVGDLERIDLPADAAVRGALRHHAAIESPGVELPFVTRLPIGDPAPSSGS